MSSRPVATPIAIIGMAARLPGAHDVEQFWSNLVNEVECITRPEDTSAEGSTTEKPGFVASVAHVDDIEMFDAEYFRIPASEAAVMDPQHRVLLELAVAALEDAGHHGSGDEVIGVYVGCGENLYLRDFVGRGQQDDPVGTDLKILAGNAKDFLAARIAFKLGLTGPSINVQTTCSTGLSAVAMACGALAAGDCDIAIAGGASLLMPDVEGYDFVKGGILSADGRCRAFDADATGTVPGAGAALVVLRRDDEARDAGDTRRAVIRGWAVNNDGGSGVGFTAPSAAGQQAVITAAMARAGVDPEDVAYVETHGTGTALGDPIEFEALRRVFAHTTETCVLGAVKPNIGHTDTAAGVAGLIKAALVVERGTIPATLHFRRPNPAIDLEGSRFEISGRTRDWQRPGRRLAGVSAFGLGGNNTHVVLERAEPTPVSKPLRDTHVVVLSARSEGELLEQRTQLARWVRGRSALCSSDLADVGFTLAEGRPAFQYRWATAVSDADSLVVGLCEDSTPPDPTQRWTAALSGTPGQLADLGRRLMKEEPLFRPVVQRLGGEVDLEGLTEAQLAALCGVCVVQVLQDLGLRFARVDSPAWADPVVDWFLAGGHPSTLPAALAGVTERAEQGRGTAAHVLVDQDFALPAAVAAAWARGATVEWSRYFGGERRHRVPLPTYPFARRRAWLTRRTASTVPETEATVAPMPLDDVAARVEQVWREALGLASIDHGAHFVNDLAGDSVFALDIGAELSETFHLDLPVDLPFVAPTVAETADYIRREAARAGAVLPGQATPAVI